jgi:DNA (cytosine-5)-methyltransferase 1
MMGLPAGWVVGRLTGRSARNAALRILGNGVVPAQGAAAYTILLQRLARP